MLNNSKVFSEVLAGEISHSTDFRYICLSRFVNIMGDQVKKGTATDLNLRTDLDGDCFFASFKLDGKKIIICLDCKNFSEYMLEKEINEPSVSEIDKNLRDYVSDLILKEFKQHLNN